MNCAVLGSLLLPLKPQRRQRHDEGVNLLDDNDGEALNSRQVNNKPDLKALERGQPDKKKTNVAKQNKVRNIKKYLISIK